MQDEYVKAIDKLKMDDERKSEMRDILEKECASSREPAKKTRLGPGATTGLIAASLAATMGVLLIVPTTRDAISAGVRSIFRIEVPDGAVDSVDKMQQDREERYIPTDVVEESVASEISAAVSKQDKEEDDYVKAVTVDAEYYKDPELNELANKYAREHYTIFDLAKGEEETDKDTVYYKLQTNDWYKEGFSIHYQTGDNAAPHNCSIIVFKASEGQIQGFLKNEFAIVNYERKEHGQKKISLDDFWKKSVDAEGNVIYEGSWTGPEPDMKLLPSDSARFMNYRLTYDPASKLAICELEEGGGVG
ncbi:MAG: hypothetical protein J5657_00355 [Clostridiales bacterium]|nr:hypothetical protein [Clostridiales bacterium]